MAELKPSLINGERCDANPQQAGSGRAAAETEREGAREGDATVRPHGKTNRENPAEMTGSSSQLVTMCDSRRWGGIGWEDILGSEKPLCTVWRLAQASELTSS